MLRIMELIFFISKQNTQTTNPYSAENPEMREDNMYARKHTWFANNKKQVSTASISEEPLQGSS